MINSILYLVRGKSIPITNVVHKSERMVLYNFSVEDYHTYYVSSGFFIQSKRAKIMIRLSFLY